MKTEWQKAVDWFNRGLRKFCEPGDPYAWSIVTVPAPRQSHTCGKLFPDHVWPTPEIDSDGSIAAAKRLAKLRGIVFCSACMQQDWEILMFYGDSSHDDPRHQFHDAKEWPRCFNVPRFFSHEDCEWIHTGHDDPVPLHPTLHP